MSQSLAERLEDFTPAERREALRALPSTTLARLPYSWEFWGRPDQIWRPGLETITAYLAGRAWGKTRTGAEAVIYVARHPWLAGGRRPRHEGDTRNGEGAIIGIAGRTANDVNQTMLYGPSGIMTISEPDFRPIHNKVDKTLVWPNGAVARLLSGDVPESFRGPNLGFLWADELAHWSRAFESWQQALLALRHGITPRAIVTTTPLGNAATLAVVYECDEAGVPKPPEAGRPGDEHGVFNPRTRVVHGVSYDNAANVALYNTIATFEGTTLGLQEIHGLILFAAKGALWSHAWIRRAESIPTGVRIVDKVVAVDPAASVVEGETPEGACEIGIVVMYADDRGHLWLVDDLSGLHSTNTWGDLVVEAAIAHGARVVGEENFGGKLIESNIAAALERRNAKNKPARSLSYRGLRATRGKLDRAALVVGKWEAGGVTHVGPARRWTRLEHQLVRFTGKGASDRYDACVWGALALVGDHSDRQALQGMSNVAAWRSIADNVRARAR